MEINFEKDYLKELYENGKARSKKHRFQPSVIKKYMQTIDKLRVAKNTEELKLNQGMEKDVTIGVMRRLSALKGRTQ